MAGFSAAEMTRGESQRKSAAREIAKAQINRTLRAATIRELWHGGESGKIIDFYYPLPYGRGSVEKCAFMMIQAVIFRSGCATIADVWAAGGVGDYAVGSGGLLGLYGDAVARAAAVAGGDDRPESRRFAVAAAHSEQSQFAGADDAGHAGSDGRVSADRVEGAAQRESNTIWPMLCRARKKFRG